MRKLEGTRGAEHCVEEVVPVPLLDGIVSPSWAWNSAGHHKPKPVKSHCLPHEFTKLECQQRSNAGPKRVSTYSWSVTPVL